MRPRRGSERGKCEVLISILSRHDPSTIFTLSRNEWLDECTNLSMRFIRTLYRVKISRGLEPRVRVPPLAPLLAVTPRWSRVYYVCDPWMQPGYGRALSSEWCMVLFVDHGSPIKRRGSSVLGR